MKCVIAPGNYSKQPEIENWYVTKRTSVATTPRAHTLYQVSVSGKETEAYHQRERRTPF